MSENKSEELERLEAQIARAILGAPKRPKLRLITTADLPPKPARSLSDTERRHMCDEIRLYWSAYGIEPYVRRQMKGEALLEGLDDDALREVYEFVGRCVQSIRDGVGFDEAGLM